MHPHHHHHKSAWTLPPLPLLRPHRTRHAAISTTTTPRRRDRIVSVATGRKSSTIDFAKAFESVSEHPQQVELSVISGRLPECLSNKLILRNGPGLFDHPHADHDENNNNNISSFWNASHWFDTLALFASFIPNPSKNSILFRSRHASHAVMNDIAQSRKQAYVPVTVRKTRMGNRRHLIWKDIFRLFTNGIPVFKPRLGGLPNLPCAVTFNRIPSLGIVARTDASIAQTIDPHTLQPGPEFTFRDIPSNTPLNGLLACSHGKYDPISQEYFNVSYTYGPTGRAKYQVFRVTNNDDNDKDAHLSVLAEFSHQNKYLHDLILTEHYVIVPFHAASINLVDLVVRASFAHALRMPDKTHPHLGVAATEFVVVSRETGAILSTFVNEDDNRFFFHIANAYETHHKEDDHDHDDVVIDVVQYDSLHIWDDMSVEHLRNGRPLSKSMMARYILHNVSSSHSATNTRKVAERNVVFDDTIEYPSVRSPGQEHTHVYGVASLEPSTTTTGISQRVNFGVVRRVDVRDGSFKDFCARSDGAVLYSEPVFVPATQQQQQQREHDDDDEEDEEDTRGVLCVVETDVVKSQSAFVVVDARSMEEVARVILPTLLPVAFHGDVYDLLSL